MGAKFLAVAAPGQTVQGVLMDMAAGTYWNGASMESYASAHLTTYGVGMPEDTGSGRYIFTMPGGVPNGNYLLTPYLLTTPPNLTLGGDTALDIARMGWRDGNIIDIASGLNVVQINGSAVAAANLAVSAATFVIGAVAAGTISGSQMTTNLAPANAFTNMYAARTLIFTSGVNAGLAVLVTAFSVTGGKLTFVAYNSQPAPAVPSVGDTFIIF